VLLQKTSDLAFSILGKGSRLVLNGKLIGIPWDEHGDDWSDFAQKPLNLWKITIFNGKITIFNG